MNLSSNLSNLAATGEKFTPDELSLIFGTCVPDAIAVLDPQECRILAGNRRLQELFELDLGASQTSPPLDQFVHPDDRGLFRTWISEDFTETDGSFELRMTTPSKQEFSSEVHVSNFRWKRRDYLIAFIRPTLDAEGAEKELKDKIAEQKRKTLEAIKSSLLIYQFTEKIKKTPVLTANLLSTENEAQLFERAARILTGDGLNYKDVTFFLVDGTHLEVCHSTKPFKPKRFALGEDNTYTKFVRECDFGLKMIGRETLVPLQSRGTLLGLIEVTMHPRERIFFDELNLVSAWQKDALLTIGDMIALLLDNLRLYREVEQKSITDTLTGVHNRHYFISRLASEINRCTRAGKPVSLIFVDVDRFKEINDTYGHLQGDDILQRLGMIFKENTREYDVVCRYGGDEFVILLPEADGEQAQALGHKLLERVRNTQFMTLDGPSRRIDVSISLGASELNEEISEDLFLKTADDALYKAKEQGRNQLVFSKV